MQFICASVVVVSGTVLWISGAVLETQAYASPHGIRIPGEFAQWGGLAVLGLGVAMIVRMANLWPIERK